ncbi:MAG TPA: type II toxin-antitoxin system PemK/MazF family toxin [Acidimicrobiales bacterium]|nr:type II toxin-antitoxin system PemK/MazF family toxin [Acidimicrobiales bacterium]
MIDRGDLWWANLGEPRGSAPGLHRPVVVVQAAPYNRSRLQTVIVVAVTTNLRLAASPGNVVIAAGLAGLEYESVVNVTQVTTVDRDDLVEALGALPPWLLEQVDQGLRRVLAL